MTAVSSLRSQEDPKARNRAARWPGRKGSLQEGLFALLVMDARQCD